VLELFVASAAGPAAAATAVTGAVALAAAEAEAEDTYDLNVGCDQHSKMALDMGKCR
jgi:hypothetical protein